MGTLGPWTLGTMGPLEPYGTFGTCEKLCEGKLCDIVKQLKNNEKQFEAMTHCSAAVQSADGCAGVNPQVGLRPQAKFYGTNIVWDSHRVNKLTAKYLRLVMDPEHLLLPSYCLQHHTGEVRQPAPPVLPPDCGRQPSYCLARYMSRER